MAFGSITPENDFLLSGRMVDAVFESSQTPDFSETRMIHKITKMPGLHNKVEIKRPITCRYIRYRAPEGSYCNVSEIVFFDLSGNKLEGIHIGSPGSHRDSGNTGDKAFDGDITTFYDAVGPEESWTGLDFGEEKKIATLHYSPRLANIGIYQGYEYELFCLMDNSWKSIGKKTATGQTIEFNVPKKSLLYLNNNSAKKKGKVFFILDDKILYYN